MFENRLLDAFSRTPFYVVPMVFLPAVAYLVYQSVAVMELGIGSALGLMLLGALAWTLAEYWLHRTFFHWEPPTSWGPKLHFLVHGVHHDHPHDPYRLVMPLMVSIPLFFIVLWLWTTLLGSLGWAFHGGFVLGYVVYDLTHYYLHHGKPKHRLVRKLRGHHMSHHFNRHYADKRYGVSTRIWDRVFGTS